MDAAEAAGGEDLDARGGGEFHGGADGGGGVGALVEEEAEVGGVGLGDGGGGEEGGEFVGGEADDGAAVEDADEGGGAGAVGDDLAEVAGEGRALVFGDAVEEEGWFRGATEVGGKRGRGAWGEVRGGEKRGSRRGAEGAVEGRRGK